MESTHESLTLYSAAPGFIVLPQEFGAVGGWDVQPGGVGIAGREGLSMAVADWMAAVHSRAVGHHRLFPVLPG